MTDKINDTSKDEGIPEKIYIQWNKDYAYKKQYYFESDVIDSIEFIPKSLSDKKVKQLEYALHCEIGRTKWIKNMFGIEKPILDSPCIFCGYNGQGYWQIGTHEKKCPWHKWGGEAERNNMLPDVIRKLYTESDKKVRDATKDYEQLRETFKHCHINNGKNDACMECGLDIRNGIHLRQGE